MVCRIPFSTTYQSGASAQHRVLLVDDDVISLEILAVMLGFDGHEVLQAIDGESALSLLADRDSAASPPDVLLVDMQMPGHLRTRTGSGEFVRCAAPDRCCWG